MGSKRSKIRDKFRKSQEKGIYVNPDMLASCEGKVRYPSEWIEQRFIKITKEAGEKGEIFDSDPFLQAVLDFLDEHFSK